MTADDTIAAPATAPGEAGVAVIRISGPDAVGILAQVFRPARREREAASFPDRRVQFGELRDPMAADLSPPIDDCLAVVMRGPRSFTGEDVAEVHCHGGRAVVSAVLDLLLRNGARPAEPGEFSRRAFLNGRMDLAQAEAVGDLVRARTDLARRMAIRQLRGGLTDHIRRLQSRLLDAAAYLEAHLDFPDEDVPVLARQSIAEGIRETRIGCETLLSTFRTGRLVHEGARVVLSGAPNAGKSSLFNALLNRERAIVSPHPGTTRDTIEATVDLGGVPVTLVDTAGLREASDEIEQIGIARSTEEIEGADLILHVVDATASQEERLPAVMPRRSVVRLLNKSDLVQSDGDVAGAARPDDSAAAVIAVSAATRRGIELVEKTVAEILLGADPGEDTVHIVHARHAECLRQAIEALSAAQSALDQNLSGEFVMVDLREALLALGDILGERLDEQILDRVFSTFCLGK